MSPRRTSAKSDPQARVRALCLALPETSEKISHGRPSFRARERMFAMFMDDHHGDGRVAVWLRAAPGAQEILVGADPERFFVPPYMGPSGWIGMRVDLDPDWDEVADHVREAHREALEGQRPKRAASTPRAVRGNDSAKRPRR